MRRIAVVTVGRSDFGIYLPILRAIAATPGLSLHLIAAGAHLSPAFGSTVDDLAGQGFPADEHVDMLLAADTPVGIAKSMGVGLLGFAQVYDRLKPDLLLVLGDRFEMHAAAVAAVPFKLPIAHVHGGEVTMGAIDDVFRHAMTKYSHLHFASTQAHASRIIQLGEEPWRVTVSGAPSLDNLRQLELPDRNTLEHRLDLDLSTPPLVVTYHPVTLQFEQTEFQMTELLAALSAQQRPIVFTKPNADTNSHVIIEKLNDFARKHANVRVVDNLGTQAYFSLMNQAAAMVGNSSSGIIEAASFELPVVNVGIRQAGRPRSANIVDVGENRAAIERAIERVLQPSFRQQLQGLVNIYGGGTAGTVIAKQLSTIPLDDRLIHKRFHDLPPPAHQVAA